MHFSSSRHDGVNWIFSSRSQTILLDCCFNCSYTRPPLTTATLTENHLQPFYSPFFRTDLAMRDLVQVQEPPNMKLTVTMDEFGLEGSLVFQGEKEICIFNSEILVTVGHNGLQQIFHKSTITGIFGTLHSSLQSHDTLLEMVSSQYLQQNRMGCCVR